MYIFILCLGALIGGLAGFGLGVSFAMSFVDNCEKKDESRRN